MIVLHLTFPDSAHDVALIKNKEKKLDHVVAGKIKDLYKFFVKERCSFSYNEKKLLGFLQELERQDKFYFSSKSLLRFALKEFSKSPFDDDSTKLKVVLYKSARKQKEYAYIWSVSEIFKWLVDNRNNQRKYNHNFKHPVNQTSTHTRNGKVVSACEGTIDEAAALLPYAITFSERHLFAYDPQRGKIMEFRSEDKGTTFHGFHVNHIDSKFLDIIERLMILHPNNIRNLKKHYK